VDVDDDDVFFGVDLLFHVAKILKNWKKTKTTK